MSYPCTCCIIPYISTVHIPSTTQTIFVLASGPQLQNTCDSQYVLQLIINTAADEGNAKCLPRGSWIYHYHRIPRFPSSSLRFSVRPRIVEYYCAFTPTPLPFPMSSSYHATLRKSRTRSSGRDLIAEALHRCWSASSLPILPIRRSYSHSHCSLAYEQLAASGLF